MLDVDHLDGYGPETVTVARKHSGERYIYAVQNFSDRQDPASNRLSLSDAKVFVYIGQTSGTMRYASTRPRKQRRTNPRMKLRFSGCANMLRASVLLLAIGCGTSAFGAAPQSYVKQDATCDGFPRVAIEMAAGFCVGLVTSPQNDDFHHLAADRQ